MDDDTIKTINICRHKTFFENEMRAAHAHMQMAKMFKKKLIEDGCEGVEEFVNEVEERLQ